MSHLIKRQKGLAVIELTMILPFLLLLIFATAEFSRLLYQYNALNHLVRDALRYTVSDVVDGSTIATQAAVDGMAPIAENLLRYGEDQASAEILPNITSSTISLVGAADPLDPSIYYVTLTVTYNWQPIFGSSLNTFVSADTVDLSFPLVVNYTMRAL
ncbi:TadE/TadG family type IV pilus assembly protein [Thalassotalea fonticola]|uniref:TadE/TadG family type IV pilus assembly protein n=1 Tax=Thalassotalea fonticola TaxID=3065649 RepID=A0ABZ0GTC0_9GAMM|nr:TadE/TadG family type IV pilus assembly protein [Colwelliaceae bacterium S1-1]